MLFVVLLEYVFLRDESEQGHDFVKDLLSLFFASLETLSEFFIDKERNVFGRSRVNVDEIFERLNNISSVKLRAYIIQGPLELLVIIKGVYKNAVVLLLQLKEGSNVLILFVRWVVNGSLSDFLHVVAQNNLHEFMSLSDTTEQSVHPGEI